MLVKHQLTCHICVHDQVLRGLKTKVQDIATELRTEWRSSQIVRLDNNILPGDRLNWFVVTGQGRPTVIPSYSLYDQTWRKAIIFNPFDVEWLLLDVHDKRDSDYLHSLVEILEDQQALWLHDELTQGASILVMFTRFIKAVKRLLMHCMNVTY